MKRFSYSFFLKGIICGPNEKGYQCTMQLSNGSAVSFAPAFLGPGRGSLLLCGAGRSSLKLGPGQLGNGVQLSACENLSSQCCYFATFLRYRKVREGEAGYKVQGGDKTASGIKMFSKKSLALFYIIDNHITRRNMGRGPKKKEKIEDLFPKGRLHS